MPASSPSLEKLEKICAKNPTSILFARLAEGFLLQGNVKRASEICRQGLRYRPSYVAGHVVMGKCHLAMGHFEEARQEFQKVLQLDADHPSALWHLGQIDLQLGWEDLALRHFEMARVLDPFNAQLADQIARLKQVAPRVQAEEDCVVLQNEAEGDDSGKDVAVILQEDAGADEGNAEVAETAHQEATEPVDEISPPDVTDTEGEEDLSALVSALQTPVASDTTENVDEDGDVFIEKASPKQIPLGAEPIATATLAELYAQQGLVEQAVATLEQVLARDPNNTHAQTRLAELRS